MKEQSKGIHTERLTIRVSRKLLERIRRRARAKEMTVSTYVRMVVVDDIMNEDNGANPHHPFMDKEFQIPKKEK